MNAPQRFDTTAPTDTSDDCCDICCGAPVAVEMDGDKLCQECTDTLLVAPVDDDLLPLSHPTMRRAMDDYRRLTDSELAAVSREARRFGRAR